VGRSAAGVLVGVKPNRISHNFLYNLAGLALPLAVAVASVPLFVRYAGLERLGFLTLAFAVLGYLSLLDLGLTRVFARRIAVATKRNELGLERTILERAERWLLIGTSLLAVLLAVVVPTRWLAGAQASAELQVEVHWAWIPLVAALPALVLSNLWRGAIEGLEAFALSNALRIGLGIATYAIPLLMLLVTPRLPALVLGIAAVRWVSYQQFRRRCLRMLPRLECETADARFDLVRTAFFEGGWMTLSNVIGPVMVVFDRFALATFVPLSVLSTYTVPQELALRAVLLPGALSQTIFPRLAALDAGGGTDDAAGRLVDKALRAMLALMLPVCIAGLLLAQPVLALWVGAQFSTAAAPLLQILLVGVIGNTIAQAPFGLLQAVGASRTTALTHLVELPLYLAAVWIAIRGDGVQGAALAWSGRMVVDALAMMALARVKQPSVLTPRGAYAAVTSTASSAAVATAMLLEIPMAPLWTLGLVVVSVLLGATFLRRDERWAMLSIALPWLRASTEAGKP
jgi:O-antigen/teichoic acid export membrane protein